MSLSSPEGSLIRAADENCLPLFPLSQVLLPGGRMQLRIFEARYLDLIKRCSRESIPFGVLWLREGSEVMGEAGSVSSMPDMAPMGCTANIVDWDSLDNGLLGITIEGEQRFEWQRVWQEESGLYMAAVDYLLKDSATRLPQDCDDLQSVLQQLVLHPHLQGLGLDADIDDAGVLANVLAQVLPIEAAASYQLLAVDDPLHRLALLQDMLERMRDD